MHALTHQRHTHTHTYTYTQIFQEGALLLDEVDLILHPLKSELNWPMGEKLPLDCTIPAPGDTCRAPGIRWLIQFHVLDAVFFCETGRTCLDWSDNANAKRVLQLLCTAFENGRNARVVQSTPHIVVVDPKFYHNDLKILFVR